MPERICKLQPDRTVSLRGFDGFYAAATVHDASPAGFTVSGTFRDPADFAVVVLYDADNFYEHPSIKYLPDFDFSGLTLSFNVIYSDGAQPLDSPKFNWIDWATLDCILADGSIKSITLWDQAELLSPNFPAASATINVITNAGGIEAYDRLTLWFNELAFDYIVGGLPTVEFQFFAMGAGTVHSITVNGVVCPHTEGSASGPSGPVGESSQQVAAALIAAVNSGTSQVIASQGSTPNAVKLAVLLGAAGTPFPVTTSNGDHVTMLLMTPDLVAAQIVAGIEATDWAGANTTHALLASNSGPAITIMAARYGTVNVTGSSVTFASGHKFAGLVSGDRFRIAGVDYAVAAVTDPLHLTLQTPATNANGAPYVAPRGGHDGNLIQMYTLHKTNSLAFDQDVFSLSGGSSNVTWNITLPFTALGIDNLRQCWLTFAPALIAGPFPPTDWQVVFSNWQLSGPPANQALAVAGPGSVRVEEDSSACIYTGSWTVESGFFSQYLARVANKAGASVTVTYHCQQTHDLYIGTSLYIDRGSVSVTLDGAPVTPINGYLNTGSAVNTRRRAASQVAPGGHTVMLTLQQNAPFYFDFLEAAVVSDVPDALPPRASISPALDFDTDHTYKLPPARLMWIMDKLGYAGPMNEYLGVFWWNQRVRAGGSFSVGQVTFSGAFAAGDVIVLNVSKTPLSKQIFPADTPATIALHFAAYINSVFTGAWAAASGPVLTITGSSPAAAYTIAIQCSITPNASATPLGTGQVNITQVPGPGSSSDSDWLIDDTSAQPLNHATRDWHADFYALCAARSREVTTACSMELVYPPAGYVARFPDAGRTPVSTATGFGSISSNHCAIGGSKILALQKAVYREIASLQANAGLTPSVQFGEFLWWYFAGPGGMAFYDDETIAAAQSALGRPLHIFLTPDDDPSVNNGADAAFLRNRLRDHVAALIADLRSAYPTARCEVLWPYDVNHPTPVPTDAPYLGGRLNYAVNLPAEWRTQPTSGLDRMKVEALAFGQSMRNLDLSSEAVNLFQGFGWPVSALRYLVPLSGSIDGLIAPVPWYRELALALGAGIATNNLWAFDHVCLFNLEVPEPALERRSWLKAA
ncbi:MAG TPA: hypothetical protein VKB79_04105 [Bryobacteraceae bacterium]|nr:hypothetical protein [Bryobacteraceae bacterium]